MKRHAQAHGQQAAGDELRLARRQRAHPPRPAARRAVKAARAAGLTAYFPTATAGPAVRPATRASRYPPGLAAARTAPTAAFPAQAFAADLRPCLAPVVATCFATDRSTEARHMQRTIDDIETRPPNFAGIDGAVPDAPSRAHRAVDE